MSPITERSPIPSEIGRCVARFHGGRRLALWALAVALMSATAACARMPGKGGPDVLAGESGAVVYATTKCEVGNPDGVRCDKKTCKADEKGDCKAFAAGCLEYGNYYQGSADGGTCSRVY